MNEELLTYWLHADCKMALLASQENGMYQEPFSWMKPVNMNPGAAGYRVLMPGCV